MAQASSAVPAVVSSPQPSECDNCDISTHYLQEKGISTANAASSNEKCPFAVFRTSAPTCLNIAPLLPQTHKVAHGQLIIMPSRNLLVDLREGERRAGGKGTSLLIISPDGQQVSGCPLTSKVLFTNDLSFDQIKKYEALHLSTPSVLSEPQAIWALDELPERYWRSYKLASQYIEALKKQTPWVGPSSL
jgi:polo-like kinase 4